MLKVWLSKPPTNRSIVRSFDELFSVANKVVRSLGFEVTDVFSSRLYLVTKSTVRRKVMEVEAVSIKVDREFRIVSYPDLSRYSSRHAEGRIVFFATYNGKDLVGVVHAHANVMREVREEDGDLYVTAYNDRERIDGIADLMTSDMITERLKQLNGAISKWELE